MSDPSLDALWLVLFLAAMRIRARVCYGTPSIVLFLLPRVGYSLCRRTLNLCVPERSGRTRTGSRCDDG